MRAPRLPLAAPAACLLAVLLSAGFARAQLDRTRLTGLNTGPHPVGFQLRTEVDSTRHVDGGGAGTPLGVAVWYPAASSSDARQPMTTLDYRMLQFATPLGERERQMFEAEEAAALPVWRHVGIVDMTDAQAVASLHTGGIAVRAAPPLGGRHPVVVVLGGAYYLSTTAEFLASHGFMVVAVVRFSDRSNAIGTTEFSWYLENSVRDAEFALSTLHADPRADTNAVAAIGHGGGGMQAMLFAMRNRRVRALVNIDAGSFSSRSGGRVLPFYSPRLVRVPFLYVATTATRSGQDQFEDFQAMKFSQRYEVIVEHADVRHHDLSDLGRPVTEPMQIRGAAQQAVQRTYADLHEMTLRFLREHAGAAKAGAERFAVWAAAAHAAGAYAVTAYPRVEPAPTIVEIEQTLGTSTPALLRDAQRRDPEAPLFGAAGLLRVAKTSLARSDFTTAIAVADLGAAIHAASPLFPELKSHALESSGAREAARAVAAHCAAMPSSDDWRAGVAIRLCAARVNRLSSGQGSQPISR